MRKEFTQEVTLGELYIDNEFSCFVLEDAVRPEKIYGETAIPAGEYQILLTISPRFKRVLPLLVDVPGFDGIRIHPGNSHEDTHGCLLVGDDLDHSTPIPTIRNSVKAFNRLFRLMQQARHISINVRSANES